MMDEGQERVQATYRDNYARLAADQEQYDPDNLFRVNQNIRPAGAEERAQRGLTESARNGRLPSAQTAAAHAGTKYAWPLTKTT